MLALRSESQPTLGEVFQMSASTHSESQSLGSYRRSLADVPRLNPDEERVLAERWQAGDRAAGDQLIKSCLSLVVAIAIEYRRWGISLEDIIQQGNVGLLKAIRKFDPTRGVRLATYASYWIRADIREFVVNAYRVVRIGTTKAERRALRAYRTSQARDVDSLAEVSGLSRERVEMILPLLASREASLDVEIGDSGTAFSDMLFSNDPSPEDAVSEDEIKSFAQGHVAEALTHLSDRERMIIEERFFTEEPPSLQELGDRMGISKERVRQLEERARKKLQRELSSVPHFAEAC